MCKLKNTSIVYTNDSVVLARSNQYYVGVVKNNRNLENLNSFIVIINEEMEKGGQREVISKRFTKQSLLNKFLMSVVPDYFLKQGVLGEAYEGI
ncbi:hypothetical protein MHL30_16880 [Priestia flexa]|uniref:hypothetical protein n=1 Tax=Priestia flexa TaxID=86664 RepID=UPI001EF62816|nr:hypothetical protein [Priestia flexa]MCG7314797.1 hypothetical protein [Priestia flexa]